VSIGRSAIGRGPPLVTADSRDPNDMSRNLRADQQLTVTHRPDPTQVVPAQGQNPGPGAVPPQADRRR
jgi:hypothetical protein